MASINFYLDSKADKSKLFPIHLVIRQKDKQIKIATGEKIKKKDWDSKQQIVLNTEYRHFSINKYLQMLRNETESFISASSKSILTDKQLKDYILQIIESRKINTDVSIVSEPQEEYKLKEAVTFVDLFAGAGGFSEGFLQAEEGNKLYDFLLASDINENCELTHLVRYNFQLGLKMEFLKQDITEIDFLDNMKKKLKGRNVDVVCGGPPCQSFSLAGKRKKFDKKDDLFAHYLKVIRQLRPKYFVMENVKGILTKEGGKIREMILKEIRSIVDLKEFPLLLAFCQRLKKNLPEHSFIIECFIERLQFECSVEKELESSREKYIQNIENKFRILTPKIVDYKTSKTDVNISTIRHGFNLLKRTKELDYIRKRVINEKAYSDLDNDYFASDFDDFLNSISSDSIIQKINISFKSLKPAKTFIADIEDIIRALEIYDYTFDECVEGLKQFLNKKGQKDEFAEILDKIRLYRVDEPFVALASNYGVPQNRERVLFIGCRKDQKIITAIPPTVTSKEKVTVFEALHDLDFIGNDDEKHNYVQVDLKALFNGQTTKMKSLLKPRSIDGKIDTKDGLSYAEWSRKGRLNGRFGAIRPPFYVRNHEELEQNTTPFTAPLHNHKTSKQNDEVIKRLDVILKEGDYDNAKAKLKKLGLDSEKRNYNVLKPEGQSPTVMTIADDYIHYRAPRALTVREMARLQSFDDSFVFQGKRSTGGIKRKYEVPQFTLVGNAVPH